MSHARSVGRPREAGADERIMRAAVAEYATYGKAGFSLNGVARRAGVGKSSIYLRWQDKERLLEDAVAASAEELDPVDTGSLEGDLRALMVSVLRSWDHPATLVRHRMALDALPGSQATFEDVGLHAVPDARPTMDPAPTDALLVVWKRAEERGEVSGTPPTPLLADLVGGSLMLLVLRRGSAPHGGDDELASIVAPYAGAVLAAAKASA
ncbi:TetR/AcrR family transcriptional regulator [Nocardioides sp. GY 10127]|uniref:TetR/AcrR family transcriptional regulator n=1 Tax=Nocardioides sp. GY 10127 TaxID=2569762 RepID=UPI0014583D6A|nr:TetR/AcrR family transcriptional regulator [Nocardioides sp. GY 10127]